MKPKKILSLCNLSDTIIQPHSDLIFRKRRKTNQEISLIIDNIYLSGIHPALDIEKLNKIGITHIINCATSSKIFSYKNHEGIRYSHLDMKDDPSFNILFSVLKSIDFIENALRLNGKVLIHCIEGISRGPTILACYLMWKYSYDRDFTLRFLKERRECVDINFGFLLQITKFWKILNTVKENHIFQIDIEGNLNFYEKEEFNEEFWKNSSVVFIFRNSKLHQYFLKDKQDIYEKSSKLMILLEKYLNYTKEYVCYNKKCISHYN